MPVRSAHCLKHRLVNCSQCIEVTDAARRMCGIINTTVAFRGWDELNNGYMAFRLDDGSSNCTLYDSYEDAIRHTDDKQHCYFCFRQAIGGANETDCQIFLNVHRARVDAGIPVIHPETRRFMSPIISVRSHDIMRGRIEP
jgi:hypothetical protein